MKDNILERARKGVPSYGLTLSISDPVIVEIAARAGYDFIRIDCEHMMFDHMMLMNMIRTAKLLNLPVQVRVSDLSMATALLDLGADALMIPHCRNRAVAEQAVDIVKYGPLGHRGMSGSSRALNFGQYTMQEYSARANQEIALIVQIEDEEGLQNLDDIFSVEGVDMVATGKNDLSQALGIPGQNQHPRVIAAEDLVIRKALEYQKIPTLLVKNRNRLEQLRKQGVNCFSIARDDLILYNAVKNQLNTMKQSTEGE